MRRKFSVLLVIIILSFLFGIWLGHVTRGTMTEDERFETYTHQLFSSQIQGNTVNLHYTLASPEDFGIKDYPITLGRINIDSFSGAGAQLENERQILHNFDYDTLSKSNRLTYDILDLSLETDLLLDDNYLMTELLGPTLGIQAQLPVLLAEYSFRSKQDVTDYLALIELVDSYFAQIADFEQAKSDAGFFMNETTAQNTIEQCSSFIQNPKENYLISIFENKMADCSFLSDSQKEKYITEHARLIEEHVICAYQNLIQKLQDLKQTGTNPYGLCYYPNGKEYYKYLVKSITGVCEDIPTIETRLQKQLKDDYFQVQRVLKVHPEYATDYEDTIKNAASDMEPAEILTHLQEQMVYDFPSLPETDYRIKYVDPALANYLSPAFYLTPPFDALSPNSIYLNQASDLAGMTLYTTLAHEGFPGHLYQTQYFAQTNPDPLRYMLEPGGYVEGWATYMESYAALYAPIDRDMGQLQWLNRSMNLCLYSLMDIGIHYRGWTPDEAGEFLTAFGIGDPQAIASIYQCILEDPANYLQYYVGCLNFMDLRDESKEKLGNDFDLQSFHRQILELGPAPFDILRKYLNESPK